MRRVLSISLFLIKSTTVFCDLLFILTQDENDSELFCRTCDQYFSSLHNKKEHMFGRQHLQMLTGEFEREAETMATASINTNNHVNTTEPRAPSGPNETFPSETSECHEPILDVAQFTEKFLEKNLSK